jgi:ABC-type xylose transport system permease subunit
MRSQAKFSGCIIIFLLFESTTNKFFLALKNVVSLLKQMTQGVVDILHPFSCYPPIYQIHS